MPADPANDVIFRQLGLQPYQQVWDRMKDFTDGRDGHTPDEIWLLHHEPVFTLGHAGESCHVLEPGDIPVIKSDRGGQVSYHGPGQLIAYLLIDLRRRGIGIKRLVTEVEQTLIELLAEMGIEGLRRDKAPGVYVNERKIASLGLRVRNNCTSHGLSLNVAMNLAPFSRINVCGYKDLEVTQISDLVSGINETDVVELLCTHLIKRLGYIGYEMQQGWSKASNGKNEI